MDTSNNTITQDAPRDTHLNASKAPLTAIKNISYAGQPDKMKMYKSGYEQYFNSLPVMNDEDEDLQEKVSITQAVMRHLSSKLQSDKTLLLDMPQAREFDRTIIGLEEPIEHFDSIDNEYTYDEGKEIVIARWGDGFTSPVHGHAAGYMHEELLAGIMKVNQYQIVDAENRVVRPLRTDIINADEDQPFVSGYVPAAGETAGERSILVHNFESVGESISLHYLPEHTRDGRDNRFRVEHFGEVYPLTTENVRRVTSKDGMYFQKGDVVLVRSSNVPEYGDHFIVVTGPPTMKLHGFRVDEVAVMASANDTSFIDENYKMRMGLILLKLNKEMKEKFLHFHNIEIENGNVIFPKG